LKEELSERYRSETEGWLRSLRTGKPPAQHWTPKYPFYKFTAEDLPPGLHASFWPDGQLQKIVAGSTTLELAHGKPAGRMSNGAWTEEYHADGTWEAWGGLVDRDREQSGQTFQQWVRSILERLGGGIGKSAGK